MLPHLVPPVFRPPSEARSLIIQLTLGCSNNRCAFCAMYRSKKFRIRPLEEVLAEIDALSGSMGRVRRVFLADGDALAAKSETLLQVLERLRERLPLLERTTLYAQPRNLLRKSPEELVELRRAGLTMAYLGIESGDDQVLERISKGATSDQTIESIVKAQAAGIDISATILLGLGGVDDARRHMEGSARVVNEGSPRYASALSVILGPMEDEYRRVYPGWEEPNPTDLLREVRILVDRIAVRVTFRANHASNYLPIKAELPEEREKTLALIDRALDEPGLLRPEWMRGL